MVAFEMARRLESIGETVALVALLDASNPAFERSLSTSRVLYLNARFMTHRFLHHFRTISSMKPREWRSYSSAPLKTFLRLAAEMAKVVTGRSGPRASIKVPPSQLEALLGQREFEETLARVMEASRLAAQKFVPKPYSGHLHVFRARVRHEDPYDNEALGWRSLALGGVTVFEIDGDHETIFRQPGVAAIAEILAKALRSAQLDTYESAHAAQEVTLV
jgi:thioesterase domain-containing protein